MACGVVLMMISGCASLPALRVRTDRTEAPTGGLTQEQVMLTMLDHKPHMAACVVAGGSGPGTMLFMWDVTPAGFVENIAMANDEFVRHPTAHCIAESMKTWRFPASATGVRAIVFPMKF